MCILLVTPQCWMWYQLGNVFLLAVKPVLPIKWVGKFHLKFWDAVIKHCAWSKFKTIEYLAWLNKTKVLNLSIILAFFLLLYVETLKLSIYENTNYQTIYLFLLLYVNCLWQNMALFGDWRNNMALFQLIICIGGLTNESRDVLSMCNALACCMG